MANHIKTSGHIYDQTDNLADYLITVTAMEDVDWPEFYKKSDNYKQNIQVLSSLESFVSLCCS
mgnify:CR=1 FL=1